MLIIEIIALDYYDGYVNLEFYKEGRMAALSWGYSIANVGITDTQYSGYETYWLITAYRGYFFILIAPNTSKMYLL